MYHLSHGTQQCVEMREMRQMRAALSAGYFDSQRAGTGEETYGNANLSCCKSHPEKKKILRECKKLWIYREKIKEMKDLCGIYDVDCSFGKI